MVLKTTTALVAFGSLLIGATASPIEVPAGSVPEGSYPADSVPNNVPAKTDENADTWFIWSDSSRCENQERIQVVIRDYNDRDEKGIIKSRPDIQGEKQPTGEILFKLKSPFYGSYVLSDTQGQTYKPPEVKIELFEKGKKPAGRATYEPGSPPREFDRLQWNPDEKVPNQKILRPSLDNDQEMTSKENPDGKSYTVSFSPLVGKEDSVETDTYADTLWILWVWIFKSCSAKHASLTPPSAPAKKNGCSAHRYVLDSRVTAQRLVLQAPRSC
ncbi:hypothetical protein IWZ01DRAFT_480373 [Phyllosticta capitalensis]